MQSHKSNTAEERIPLPLPWGFGSMSWRGCVWRLAWRDPAGEIHYESSRTADAAEAQRIMAVKALPRAQAMVEALERIAHGETYREAGKGSNRAGPGPVAPVGAAPAAVTRKARSKGRRRGGKA
jgi:hypothetical protein